MRDIDPNGTDQERAVSETAWFKAHPLITVETREKRRAMGQKNKGFISGNSGKKTVGSGPGWGFRKKGIEIPPA
jgi:hypothetical protein